MWFIANLDVDFPFRFRGIGRSLVERVIEECTQRAEEQVCCDRDARITRVAFAQSKPILLALIVFKEESRPQRLYKSLGSMEETIVKSCFSQDSSTLARMSACSQPR